MVKVLENLSGENVVLPASEAGNGVLSIIRTVDISGYSRNTRSSHRMVLRYAKDGRSLLVQLACLFEGPPLWIGRSAVIYLKDIRPGLGENSIIHSFARRWGIKVKDLVELIHDQVPIETTQPNIVSRAVSQSI